MNDPFAVLGVSQRASDDEVKRAYRELARKYHPDNYHDNPLADLAQEKMKEINEAYDQIMKMRTGGGNSSSGSSRSWSYSGNSSSQQSSQQSSGSSSGYSSQVYAEIRNAINSGNLSRAEQLLNGVSNHDAEWNFLMGSVFYRKGWLDEASRCYQAAVNMEPGNAEYRQALSYMQSSGGSVYRYRRGGIAGMDSCDLCSSLLCADCCCECMGGDLIPCC